MPSLSMMTMALHIDDDCYIHHEDFFSGHDGNDMDFYSDYIHITKDDYDHYICSNPDFLSTTMIIGEGTVFHTRKCCSISAVSMPQVRFNVHHHAQIDSGADCTTMPHRELIHNF